MDDATLQEMLHAPERAAAARREPETESRLFQCSQCYVFRPYEVPTVGDLPGFRCVCGGHMAAVDVRFT